MRSANVRMPSRSISSSSWSVVHLRERELFAQRVTLPIVGLGVDRSLVEKRFVQPVELLTNRFLGEAELTTRDRVYENAAPLMQAGHEIEVGGGAVVSIRVRTSIRRDHDRNKVDFTTRIWYEVFPRSDSAGGQIQAEDAHRGGPFDI